MGLRSFMSGIFFLIGLELILPLVGVRLPSTLPYAPISTIALGIGCFILAYYMLRGWN